MDLEIHFKDIKEKILTELQKANDSIIVAVAWFTDHSLFEALLSKVKTGVQVEIMINDDDINKNSGLNYTLLSDYGGVVFLVDDNHGLMHNKFCVIDDLIVINGSFNWTRKASVNLENIIVHNDPKFSSKFKKQFNDLKLISNQIIEKEDLEREIDHENFDFNGVLNLIENKIEKKDYISTLYSIRWAEKKYPEKEFGLAGMKADCQIKLQNLTGAIHTYNKYLDKYPDCFVMLTLKGYALNLNDNFREALNAFSKAIDCKHDYLFARYLRIKLIEKIDFDFENIPIFLKIRLLELKHHRNDTVFKDYFNQSPSLEYSFWQNDNIDRLRNLLITDCKYFQNQMLTTDNEFFNNDEVTLLLYKFYPKIYKKKQAIDYWSELISRNPNKPDLYFERATAFYYQMDMIEEASYDIRKAVSIAPEVTEYIHLYNEIKRERRKRYWRSWFQ